MLARKPAKCYSSDFTTDRKTVQPAKPGATEPRPGVPAPRGRGRGGTSRESEGGGPCASSAGRRSEATNPSHLLVLRAGSLRPVVSGEPSDPGFQPHSPLSRPSCQEVSGRSRDYGVSSCLSAGRLSNFFQGSRSFLATCGHHLFHLLQETPRHTWAPLDFVKTALQSRREFCAPAGLSGIQRARFPRLIP